MAIAIAITGQALRYRVAAKRIVSKCLAATRSGARGLLPAYLGNRFACRFYIFGGYIQMSDGPHLHF
jgi:hypothetical protein